MRQTLRTAKARYGDGRPRAQGNASTNPLSTKNTMTAASLCHSSSSGDSFRKATNAPPGGACPPPCPPQAGNRFSVWEMTTTMDASPRMESNASKRWKAGVAGMLVLRGGRNNRVSD
jgi:hypothetical protein